MTLTARLARRRAPSGQAHTPSPQRRPARWGDALALALYAALIVGLHAPLVFANAGLADFDLMGYFYPYWQYRHEALRSGALPLWNPHLFTGVPFVANIQTAVFYPLNWPLTPLDAPRAVALSYVAHLWIAAAGMHALLRARMGAAVPAAAGGALVFALGGFLAAQAGHINQVQAAAWLPALLLAFLMAHARRSLWWALLGGVVLALQATAGHPQETYLSLAALAALAGYEGLRCAFGDRDAWFNRTFADREWFILRILGWAAFSAAVLGVVLAAGATLAAAQLLPSLELSGQGIRSGGLPYDAAVSFSLAPWELLRALLPTHGEPPLTEFIAAPGVVALALCLAALLHWPWHRYTLYFLLLALGGIFFAVGNFAFWYPWVYDYVPGINLFRVPARWLFLTAFGTAGLAALGLQALLSAAPGVRPTPRAALAAALILAAVAALAVVPAWSYASLGLLYAPAPGVIALWFVFGVPAAVLAVAGVLVWRAAAIPWVLLALLLVELPLARAPMPVSHPLPADVFRTVRPGLSHLVQDGGQFRVLSLADPAFEPGDLPELRERYGRALNPQQVRLAVEMLKYQDIAVPNTGMLYGLDTLDAYDGGMLPTQDYAALKRALVDRTGRAPGRDQRASAAKEAGLLLRDLVGAVPDAATLGALNVKYLVADRLTDVWVDGVYHDLGFPLALRPGQRIALPLDVERPLPDGATGVSLAGYLEGAAATPQGAVVGRLTVVDIAGDRVTVPLRAGVELAESAQSALQGAAHRPARAVIDRRGLPGHHVYAAAADFGRPLHPREVVLEATLESGDLVLAGLALLDGRTGASYTPSLHPDWPRVYTGDVKVYENRRLRERAYVPTAVRTVPTDADQLAAWLDAPEGAAVLTAGTAPQVGGPVRGRVAITRYQAERVELAVELEDDGLVVLRDSYYPGWRAWVDGAEVPVLRADHLFRAVAVPAGSHTVVFTYDPAVLVRGLTVSWWAVLATGLLLAAIPAARRVRPRRQRAAAHQP